MEKVKSQITIVAKTQCAVFLRGETGTGKGMFARWIHDHGSRMKNAFVDINCSGLRGNLLKSELFGHAKGAFTSAIRDHTGLIEVANGGTLFLDEIGDMDVSVQCEILKAIEEKSYRRVGENKLRRSDFRLICATNHNISNAMAYGRFRADLFYRIGVFNINLPPLKDRREDIAGLLKHILIQNDYAHFPVSADVIDILTHNPWPGNIRELRNAIERALVHAQGKPLTQEDFSDLERAPDYVKTKPTEEKNIVWNLKTVEKAHIIRALKFFGGDKQAACAALGISQSSMYRKLVEILNENGVDRKTITSKRAATPLKRDLMAILTSLFPRY